MDVEGADIESNGTESYENPHGVGDIVKVYSGAYVLDAAYGEHEVHL